MRLIDSEILIKKAVENRSCNLSNAKYEMKNGNFEAVQQFLYYASFYALVIEMIKNVSTIDAVEVVRCKDCKYSKHLKQYPKVNTWKCTLTDVVYRADDYCSYGERKENDETD